MNLAIAQSERAPLKFRFPPLQVIKVTCSFQVDLGDLTGYAFVTGVMTHTCQPCRGGAFENRLPPNPAIYHCFGIGAYNFRYPPIFTQNRVWFCAFFPTCQARVVRFYVSCPAASLSSSAFLRRTSTASARSQCSLPDPNSNPRIRVFPAGPQLQALDRSVPCRTQTAIPGSECSPPDLNCKP